MAKKSGDMVLSGSIHTLGMIVTDLRGCKEMRRDDNMVRIASIMPKRTCPYGKRMLPPLPANPALPPPPAPPPKTVVYAPIPPPPNVQQGKYFQIVFFATLGFFLLSHITTYRIMNQLWSAFTNMSNEIIDDNGIPTTKGTLILTGVFFIWMLFFVYRK